MPPHLKQIEAMAQILREARELLARPQNSFLYSNWDDATEALQEIDTVINQLAANVLPNRNDLEILFLPTGPVQEVSINSGWGNEFIVLATRFDHAMRQLYGPHPRDRAQAKAELEGYVRQLFSNQMRWFATVMAAVAIGYLSYASITGDISESYFPVRLKGTALVIVISCAACLFGSLAIAKWVIWFKRRRR